MVKLATNKKLIYSRKFNRYLVFKYDSLANIIVIS